MMWLAITTWLVFVFASAWGYQYFRRKQLDSLNRSYVKSVDDTFTAINLTIKTISIQIELLAKNQTQLSALFVSLTDSLLALGKAPPPEEALTKKDKSAKEFIMNMEYVRDKFATSPAQKKVVEDIIGNIKKRYGRKDSASAA